MWHPLISVAICLVIWFPIAALSGGRQQSVQLARALVLDRDILPLDESLATLDAQLRKDMCLELKHLQEKVGITFIHVTHNQEEAMTIADRIALIADGKLVEQGSAREDDEAPKRRFTTSFVGNNNLLDGHVSALTPFSATLETGGGGIVVPRTEDAAAGDAATVSIRPELVTMTCGDTSRQSGIHVWSVNLGLTTSHRNALADGTEFVACTVSGHETPPDPGRPAHLTWPETAARLHLD